jgi:hypothetical protein
MSLLPERVSWRAIVGVGVLAAVLGFLAVALRAQTPRPTRQAPAATSFSQRLVETTLAAHPEADEVGIAVTSSNRCTVLASTDAEDRGAKCEADDSAPIRTGKPFVGREEGEFDISLPLHDRSGRLVGAVGIRLKAAPGQTQAIVVNQARAMAHEMEAQIPSKAALLGR